MESTKFGASIFSTESEAIMDKAWDDWSSLMKKQIKIAEKTKDKVVKVVDEGFEVAKETMDDIDHVVKSKKVNTTKED